MFADVAITTNSGEVNLSKSDLSLSAAVFAVTDLSKGGRAAVFAVVKLG